MRNVDTRATSIAAASWSKPDQNTKYKNTKFARRALTVERTKKTKKTKKTKETKEMKETKETKETRTAHDVVRARTLRPPPRHRHHPQPNLPVAPLVPHTELQVERRTGRNGVTVLVHDLVVHRHRRVGVERTHSPRRRLAHANLVLGDGLALDRERGHRPDTSAHHHLRRAKHRERRVEVHVERAARISREHSPERRPEGVGAELLREDHDPARLVHRGLHLRQPDLVE